MLIYTFLKSPYHDELKFANIFATFLKTKFVFEENWKCANSLERHLCKNHAKFLCKHRSASHFCKETRILKSQFFARKLLISIILFLTKFSRVSFLIFNFLILNFLIFQSEIPKVQKGGKRLLPSLFHPTID